MVYLGLSLLGVGSMEDRLATGPRSESVRSTVLVDAPPAAVWEELIAFEHVALEAVIGDVVGCHIGFS